MIFFDIAPARSGKQSSTSQKSIKLSSKASSSKATIAVSPFAQASAATRNGSALRCMGSAQALDSIVSSIDSRVQPPTNNTASSSPGQHHPVGTYRACNEYVMSDRAVGRRQCSSPSLRVCFRTEPWPSLPDASSVFCTTATISRISSSKLIRPSTAKRAGSAASSASKSPRSPSTNEAAAHDSHRGIANAPTKKRPSSIDENTSFWDEHARRAATVSPKRTLRPCLVGWTLRLKPPLISTQAR
mmetsp:Transcript_4002/g.11360  ORF Transcript_4002/g.11360 Transcript_4002/m.11360 type:complete len:244 (+) Transcript_4002:1344-2075(+)